MDNSGGVGLRSKLLACLVATTFFQFQFAMPQARAVAEQNAPALDATNAKISDTRATLKGVGSLQMSEGLAIIKDNKIMVLSDARDPVREAELTGEVLNRHTVTDGAGTAIHGLAFFNNGPSLPVLDDVKTQDSVELVSGTTVGGHIQSADAEIVLLKTAQGLQSFRSDQIASIKSPRAFAFTIPIESDAAQGAKPAQISFAPTAVVVSHNQVSLMRATLYKESPSKHPVARKAKLTAAVAAAMAVCFGMPVAVALSTKKVGGLKGIFDPTHNGPIPGARTRSIHNVSNGRESQLASKVC